MKPIRFRLPFVTCGLILFTIGHSTTEVPAALLTVRLSTGRLPTDNGGRLPQAWVAPANKAPQLDGRLVHADGVLYVGCELAEPKIDQLKRKVNQPDGPAYQDDSVELFLSPHPARGYFQVIISAAGAVFDRRDRGDPAAWNCGAKAAVAVKEKGWSLEAAVPMPALGVGEKLPARWRANIYRNRRAGPEGALQAFSPTFSADYDLPERFGQLLFTPEPPRAVNQPQAGVPQGITVEDLGDRGAVLLFDLSAIRRCT